MNIDSIYTGFVIDHIGAGKGMMLYKLLGLAKLECPVAMIMNATSKRMGKKDIIKIDGDIDIDMDVIGYVDPDATVNVIREGKLVEKRDITVPTELKNVLFCKNPRCITSTEQELPHIFRLTDEKKRIYRCIYCDTKANN
ncbi:MAG: aspartate carbamoyltransferase regulatory subunit [Clostridia bacterium]|nr:aspartate carbamoyltransferase regulatory subunit [Clostridia bacterium]MBR6361555.1 aspartate carbamoyltransferase regulatory subunit [Clostridia bacterium]MBR6702249.1 aspartate carbamoyltransferase regulatory subunit [Clostridia bacterium]